ncbi:hypothetical protein DIE15_29310 [Burkholderia sp. Bp9031]|nr:hypothetical protein DIE15_29310 [Burkholderia sp. Bp9031]
MRIRGRDGGVAGDEIVECRAVHRARGMRADSAEIRRVAIESARVIVSKTDEVAWRGVEGRPFDAW